MADIMHYLNFAVEHHASDLLIVAGSPVHAKVDGRIRPVDETRLMPPQTQELLEQIYRLANRPMEGFLGSSAAI